MRRLAGAAFLILRRHSGKVFAAMGCAIMAGGIIGNAMLFQSGRHPAPLFGAAPPAHATGGVELPAVPLPAPRPAEPPPSDQAVDTGARAPVEDGAAARPVPASVSKTPSIRRNDAIAQLLSDGDKADPRVIAAQQSLRKLGFTVKPTGLIDGPTRHALEKFEHDHHLPESGSVSSKLLHELATAAGHP